MPEEQAQNAFIKSTIFPDDIPSELKARDQWICWKWAFNRKTGKITKIPINSANGKYASTNNPATWGTFQRALNYFNSNSEIHGVGFVLTKEDPFLGIDFDHCIENGHINQWATGYIDLFDSYTEVTPSVTGIRVWLKGSLPPGTAETGLKREAGEFYTHGRYYTVTGAVVRNQPIKDANSSNIVRLRDELLKQAPKEQEDSEEQKWVSVLQRVRDDKFAKLDDGDWESVLGNDGHRLYPSQSEAEEAYCCIMAMATRDTDLIDKCYRQSKLFREKWDEKRGKKTYGEITIQKALEFTKDRYEEQPTITPSILTNKSFSVISAEDLIAKPIVPPEWVWDGILNCGGTSIIGGKPKIGKSVFMLNLSIAAALGDTMFGRPTKMGKVIYLALEEHEGELKDNLVKLLGGKPLNGNLMFHIGPAPIDALKGLIEIVDEHKPNLICIDILQKFLRLRSKGDQVGYEQVISAMEPIVAKARDSGAHIMMSMHARKGTVESGRDAFDEILGSIGYTGSVDTNFIYYWGKNNVRILSSRQRYHAYDCEGDPIPDIDRMIVGMNPSSGVLINCGAFLENQRDEVRSEIVTAFSVRPPGTKMTMSDIRVTVNREKSAVLSVVNSMTRSGTLQREGAGVRGNPWKWWISLRL